MEDAVTRKQWRRFRRAMRDCDPMIEEALADLDRSIAALRKEDWWGKGYPASARRLN